VFPRILAALALLALLALPGSGAAQERVAPRVGNHDTYDRAVLDWPALVDYDVTVEGRDVRIVFARPVELDLAPMVRRMGSAASNPRTTIDATSTTLSFTLPPGQQLRHFRNDRSIVLDFVRGAPNRPPLDPASTRQLAQEKAARPVREPGAPPPAAAAAPPPPPPVVAPAQPRLPEPAPPGLAVPPPLPGVDTQLPPPASLAPQTPPPAPAPPAAAPLPVPPPPPAAAAPPPAPARPAAQPAQPAPAAAAPPPPAPAAPARPAAEEAAAPSLVVGPLPPRAAGAEPLVVEVAPSAIGFRLRFPGRASGAIAAFSRGPVIWVVLERRYALDLSQLASRRREIGPADAMILDTPGPATVLRIAPPMRWNVSVARDGDSWVAEIGPRAPAPTRPSEPQIRANPDGSGGRVVVEMAGMQNILRVKDPEANDELIVIPTTTAGAAVAAARPFPDFRLMPAAQGVVIHPQSDRVQARVSGTVLEVSGGLPIIGSDSTVVDGTAATRNQELLDAARWRRPGVDHDEQRQALHRAVATSTGERRPPQRLALAQFLFASGLFHEALAQMQILETEAPRLVSLPASRVLRAASALLAGDVEDAERSLAHPSLALNDEAALWNGLVKLRLGDVAAASELVTRGVGMANRYPPPVGPLVWLDIAEAQVAAGQNDSAVQFLDLAERQPLTEPQRRRVALMRGRIMARQGDVSGALATWRPLEQGGPSPTRAEATLARIELLLENGKIDRGEAIDALDRLRFAWRGDRTELRTLIMLARMHGENANPRAGLQVLREAAQQFPEAREAREITSEMDLLFAKLFLEGEAEKLPPVQAIALFDEFRDRVPTGARGDMMVRRLVDRLVRVDLIDRAASLLDHQLRHRAGPQDRADVGARLAMVQLLGGKADQALEALATTRDGAMPEELRRERARIEARALASQGKVPDALSRIAGDASEEGEELRLEIQRQVRDWNAVAATLERRAGTPPAPGEAIADAQARAVLHQATALVLAGDAAGMERLRERFGAAMERSELAGLFRVVSAEAGVRPGDIASIVQRVNAAAPYQSFLQSYRQKLAGATPARPG
jgi:predicted negative regulator of RcsB-dependent stress response